MRDFSQKKGCERPPARRKRKFPWGGGFCLAGVWAAAWLVSSVTGFAQTLKLGPFALALAATGELGYDSNVDDVYPEEEKDGLRVGDFYWMPGMSIQSQSAAMRPSTTFNVAGDLAYKDFFYRNDLDTEVYNAVLNFQTAHPRLMLGGMASIDYSVEGIADEYVPGSASRDPVLTREAKAFANWNYRKVRLESSADYSIELHQMEQYQGDDQDETDILIGAYWDLFTWGSLYYTWEKDVTTFIQSEEQTDETIHTLGLDGAIPLELLRRPKITYSFGFAYEDEQTDATSGQEESTWEPVHTINVQDEFQLSKSINLTASATWENSLDDDEVTFQYDVNLTQLLGTRAKHSLAFTQEPESTFASNADTESTTFRYNFTLNDLFVYGLNFNSSAEYQLETPLGEPDAVTEKTTTLRAGLSHTRHFSRKLTRTLAYDYTWENSNFHDYGANEKHLVIYALTYAF